MLHRLDDVHPVVQGHLNLLAIFQRPSQYLQAIGKQFPVTWLEWRAAQFHAAGIFSLTRLSGKRKTLRLQGRAIPLAQVGGRFISGLQELKQHRVG
jgi:hypothetical protein